MINDSHVNLTQYRKFAPIFFIGRLAFFELLFFKYFTLSLKLIAWELSLTTKNLKKTATKKMPLFLVNIKPNNQKKYFVTYTVAWCLFIRKTVESYKICKTSFSLLILHPKYRGLCRGDFYGLRAHTCGCDLCYCSLQYLAMIK